MKRETVCDEEEERKKNWDGFMLTQSMLVWKLMERILQRRRDSKWARIGGQNWCSIDEEKGPFVLKAQCLSNVNVNAMYVCRVHLTN
jgi:hypothetical protein